LKKNSEFIEGVQVFFITLDKVYSSNKTNKDGEFHIEIPSNKVSNRNVILIKYPRCYGLFESFHIIEDFNKTFLLRKKCKSNPISTSRATGQVFHFPKENNILFINGKEIKYNPKNKFDYNKYKTITIERKKIIEALYGDTKKKKLLLYFQNS